MVSKTISNLMVVVGANLTALEKGLLASEKKLKRFGKDMKAVGGSLTKTFTLPLLAVGGAALAAADDMDKGYNAIRRGTGATGAVLKELEGNMKSVMKTVPQGAETVGQAIADLNTRTGATGKTLEDLTFQMLNLGRVSGEEVSTLIASTTRVFGDWDIATTKQAETLDYLFKVSQATGIGVDSLSQKVVQFGAPMRQMGFDFETTAALMGKFEKEGVNTELVMGSLRIALGKMAREGVTDSAKALQILIRRIQEAGSTGEANAIALDAFGARAGPDMAAAIREGRFEIDKLLTDLAKSEETINAAAQETLTFADHMGKLKNNAQIVMEPLGRVLLDMFKEATPYMQDATTKLQDLTQKFADLDDETRNNYLKVFGGVLVAGPLMSFLGDLSQTLTGIISLLKTLNLLKFGGLLGQVGLLIGAFTLLYKGIEAVVEQTSGLNAKFPDDSPLPEGVRKELGGLSRDELFNYDSTMQPFVAPSTSNSQSFGGLGGIERYASGGVVPGPIGSPRMAIVHGGEEVLTPQQRGQRGGITININGPISSPKDADYYGNEIVKKLRLAGVMP